MNEKYSNDCLASASEALLKYLESDQFILWAIGALFEKQKPSHVSVALFDPQHDSYLIKYSVGKRRFPESLIRLDRSSPIVEWFTRRRSKKILAPLQKMSPRSGVRSLAPAISEMKRHESAVCARINACHSQEGYLLVGTPKIKGNYTERDKIYFQTVANDIALEIEKQHYYRASTLDPLTGLRNRQSLPGQLTSWAQQADAARGSFALCMVDLDNFKQINDRYGHQAGDEVLRASAQLIKKNLRECDRAFRYGGEEFLLLIREDSRDPGLKRTNEVFRRDSREIVERLRTTLAERPVLCSGQTVTVTASIGMSFYDAGTPKNPDTVIKEADEAVYISKKNGKNCVSLFSDANIAAIR